jgi:phosphoenolpyruvate carboxylase
MTEGATRDPAAVQVRLLGDLLGRAVATVDGPERLALVERVRTLSVSHRKGGDDAELRTLLRELPAEEARIVARAFAAWFHLVNLAEDQAQARRLVAERHASAAAGRPHGETLLDALTTLRDAGTSQAEVAQLLADLRVRLVLTAHPTETRRRSVLSKLVRTSELLRRLDGAALSPEDESDVTRQLAEEVTALWLTDETRDRAPTVVDEVRNSIFWYDASIFWVVPRIMRDLRDAVAATYPGLIAELDHPLTFGSWVGGDRDGNPNVTAAVTAATLDEHQRMAVRLLRSSIEAMHAHLSVALARGVLPELEQRTDALAAMLGDSDGMEWRYSDQPFRRFLALIHRRLGRTTDRLARPWSSRDQHDGYADADELLADLHLLQRALRAAGASELAEGRLADLVVQTEVFGLHLTTLDVRLHAAVLRGSVIELLARYGDVTDSGTSDGDVVDDTTVEADVLRDLLVHELEERRPLTPAQLDHSPATRDTIELFRLIRSAHERIGPRAIDTCIVSNTEHVTDVLAPLVLARDAGCADGLDVVPLFESATALTGAAALLDALLSIPAYRAHVKRRGDQQTVMVGYSDSNKDSGYLAANWQLQRAQIGLVEVADRHGVHLTIFHGRGGSVVRGGGPANAAIRAQPAETIRGRFSMTEQGEVIASRYRDPSLAHRHLELTLHAVLVSSGRLAPSGPGDRLASVLDELAATSRDAYRSGIADVAQLRDYLESATPLEAMARLNIASRPARRRSDGGIDDLRAIPWVFAWTQSRANLPGWFGVGTALESWAGDDESRWDELRELTETHPILEATLANAEMVLAKTDLAIHRDYAGLAVPAVRDALLPTIVTEYERTVRALLRLRVSNELLAHDPALREVLALRDPYLDPLHVIQVALLERLRERSATGPDDPATAEAAEEHRLLEDAFLLATNGIAAGLRNTG